MTAFTAIVRQLSAAALMAVVCAGGTAVSYCQRRRVAVEDDSASSFLTPFPEGDVYQLTVIGDTFAEGILNGLVEAMGTDTRLNHATQGARILRHHGARF